MAFIDIDRTYGSNKVPTQDDFDNIVDGIEVFLNVTGVSDDNLQNDSITASTKLIDGSITQSKLGVRAVATSNIQDSAVTANKLATGAVTTASIANASITLAKVADNAVDTDNIVDGAIDPIHVTPNHVRNTWSSNQYVLINSGAYATVAEKTVETTGGLLRLTLNPKADTPVTGGANFFFTIVNFTEYYKAGAYCSLYRDGTLISRFFGFVNGSSVPNLYAIPTGGVVIYDTPAAGTYTYTIKIHGYSELYYAHVFTASFLELNIWEL